MFASIMNGKTLTSFFLLLFIVCVEAGTGGCANPIAPSGGPKDTIAPVLEDVSPADSTLRFNDKKITFSFDEFVQLDNWRDNVIISPIPKTDPGITSKLRTVTIKINDTLEANTTYAYNFGNAIKDVNEGNILKNYTYVFSTGKYIDSLKLSGKIIMAETGKSDSTLTVILHRSSDDSAVVKQKPRYYTRPDSKGNFIFRNLPPGVFYLYAVKDNGAQKLYSPGDAFAFAGKPVTPGNNNPPDTLYAFVEKKEQSKPTAAAPAPKPATNKTDREKEKEKEKDKRLKFSINLVNGQQDLLGNLEFVFPDALKNFDSTKAVLTNESFKPITNFTFTKDTSNKKLILSYKWPENTAFNLIVDRDFAEDSSGRRIARTDTLKFRTKKESDYGNISIRFNHLDFSKNPVLQIMKGDVVFYHVKLTVRDFHDPRFMPGEYELRILYDTNDNGVWDTGEFFIKHRQPEKVISIPKKLSVKANWDNDNTVEL